MGTCHTCGAKLPNEAKFCVVCGEPLDSATLPTNQPPDQVDKAGLASHSAAHETKGARSFAEAGPTQPVLDWSSVAYPPTEPVKHDPFVKPPSKLKPRPLADSSPFATPAFQEPPGFYTPRRRRRRAGFGCVAWLIVLVLMLILLTTSALALGQTILVPSITIANQSASSGQIHLHGTGFIPKDTITLMLDNTQPLYYSGRANTVTAKSDGTFDVTIPVGTKWRLGLHTIQALEGWSLRRAMVSFILDQAGEIPILTPIPTPLAGLVGGVAHLPDSSLIDQMNQ